MVYFKGNISLTQKIMMILIVLPIMISLGALFFIKSLNILDNFNFNHLIILFSALFLFVTSFVLFTIFKSINKKVLILDNNIIIKAQNFIFSSSESYKNIPSNSYSIFLHKKYETYGGQFSCLFNFDKKIYRV